MLALSIGGLFVAFRKSMNLLIAGNLAFSFGYLYYKAAKQLRNSSIFDEMVIHVAQGDREQFTMLNGQQEDEDDGILITPRVIRGFMTNRGLNKELRPKHLFAFGIGIVVTGWYTQWNQGLATGGPLGLLVAFFVASFIYLILFKIFGQFAARFPFDGGPYAFARQGLGTFGGYAAGMSTCLQLLAATTLVLVLGEKYCSIIYPQVQGNVVGTIFMVLLMLNLLGILVSAQIQTILTGTALSGLVLAFLAGSDSMSIDNILSQRPIGLNLTGILAALPSAMWLFLGIEGVVMASEETRKPQRDVPVSLMVCFFFAVVMSLVVYGGILGSIPWLVAARQEFTFPYIINHLQGGDRVLQSTFSVINLLVFVATLQGLINGYSRQIFALSRAGYLPALFGYVGRPSQTPAPAIIIPGLICLMVSLFADADQLSMVTLFSAITMYCLVAVSAIRLKLRFGSFSLFVVLILLAIIECRIVYQYLGHSWVIPCIWALAGIYYFLVARHHIIPDAPEESAAALRQGHLRVKYK